MKDCNETDKKPAEAAAPKREPDKQGDKEKLAGKFEDVAKLAEAYARLEAEFTRRSQYIKELEARLAQLEGTDAEQTPDEQGMAEQVARALDAQQLDAPDAAQEAADEMDADEKLRLYLQMLKESGVPIMMGSGGGSIPLQPPVRAKSVAEAGKMARTLFK